MKVINSYKPQAAGSKLLRNWLEACGLRPEAVNRRKIK